MRRKDRVARPARKVVLAPDVLGGAFFDASCRRILELWRDGAIRPVITPTLLAQYARLLDTTGVPHNIIRQWALWFTSAEKSLFLSQAAVSESNVFDLCVATARSGQADIIIASEHGATSARENSTAPQLTWLTAAAYLASAGN